jgi:EAL domain-containing protein (putative c-di-GMP-specific phosphodiesterase class I)
LSGFGRVRVYFEEMENFDIDFLKIDGGIVLEILRDPVALAKAVAIQRVAKELGLQTIAEFVEQEEIVTKLVELGIDFAQGFGISHPTPLMVTLRESKRNQ